MVTGANAGIGKVTARELARMGATIVMVCRSQARGTAALAEIKRDSGNNDVHLLLADLASQASIRQLVDTFTTDFDRLDVLVNNAGAIFGQRQISPDGLEMTFALNHMGYFLLTLGLLPLLKRSAPSRIINVSSDAHRGGKLDFDDLQLEKRYSAFPAYSASKLMNVMFTQSLARRLEGTGVTVNALHPGFVRTNFGRSTMGLLGRLAMPIAGLFARSEDDGAATSIYLASSPDVATTTGQYFVDREPVTPSASALDERAQERLWQRSEQLEQHHG